MSVDLHIHTTASDGLCTPEEVFAQARALELRAIAITDHDTVAGVAAARTLSCGGDPEVVAGVELSTEGPSGSDAHLLGLFIDPEHPALLLALDQLRAARHERASLMVERLKRAGHPIDFDDVLRHADGGAVGRVHVARALKEAGVVASVSDAFAGLIGRQGRFYVHKRTLAAADAVRAIHDAGGVAVLAHPGVSGESALLPLIDAGLDGIEAFHAEHSAGDAGRYATLAAREGLLVTGGSDFHGPGVRSAPIGGGACPGGALRALEERATLYRP
jgi:3',5'-nucleoside bisphosphate phosphatase